MTDKSVSTYYTDENVTRLIALQVIIIVLLVLFNHRIYLIYILISDFAIRAFTYLPSPLAFVAKTVSNLLGLKPQLIFGAPKKFAAAVGFVFSLAIAVFTVTEVNAAYIIGGILMLFAFLEAAFKICVGCYVYNSLISPIVNTRNKEETEKIENDRD